MSAVGDELAHEIVVVDVSEAVVRRIPKPDGAIWSSEAVRLKRGDNALHNLRPSCMELSRADPRCSVIRQYGLNLAADTRRSSVLIRENAAHGNPLASRIFELPADYWDKRADILNAVTAEQIRAAARKYLDPNCLVVVIAGPREKLKTQLKSLGPLSVIRPDGSAVAR